MQAWQNNEEGTLPVSSNVVQSGTSKDNATKKDKLLEDSGKASGRAKFIYKLHAAICKNDGGGIVTWSLDGTSFIVNNPVEFATTILPTFCSTKSFSSFERQNSFLLVSNILNCVSILFLFL